MSPGFSLLEVLVTLFIISVGLLGFADAEVKAMHELKLLQQYAYFTEQLSSLNETLQIATNKQAAINTWQQSLKAGFPQATIEITTKASSLFVVIKWPLTSNSHRLSETLYD